MMQLMPGTAGRLGVDPWRVDQNAIGGATYLRQLLIKYNGDSALALAAYNAGPGAVDKYKGVPPFAETRHYVVKVLAEYARQQRIQAEKNLQAERVKPASTSNQAGVEALRAQTAKPNNEPVAVRQ
jgi:soluble lytic murein transglycosylase